jgi:hypothetical protein
VLEIAGQATGGLLDAPVKILSNFFPDSYALGRVDMQVVAPAARLVGRGDLAAGEVSIAESNESQ